MSRDWLDKDFYATLGVTKEASSEEIKKAYKKLARENHPDLNPGDTEAEKKFKEISEASSVLGDEKKRQEYDQVRAMGASGFGGFGGQGFNVEDFGDLFGNLGDIFGFGGAGGRRKGQTYQTNINISFNDAASGVESVIPLRKEVACSYCKGTGADKGEAFHRCNICNGSGQTASNQGFFSFAQTCSACKGQGNIIDKACKTCRSSGSVIENESIKVKVPAGVDNGTIISWLKKNPKNNNEIFFKPIDIGDNTIPNGNAIMLINLVKLGMMDEAKKLSNSLNGYLNIYKNHMMTAIRALDFFNNINSAKKCNEQGCKTDV